MRSLDGEHYGLPLSARTRAITKSTFKPMNKSNTEQVHCSPAAKAFIEEQIVKKGKTEVQIVDDLCFPKQLPVKTLKGV